MLVHQAFRFELDPSNHVRAALASHAGAARFAYNWALALVVERLAARRALVVLAIRQGASLTDANTWAHDLVPVPWTLYALRREWNAAKADAAPWWAENSKEAYSSGLDCLARALKAFGDSRSGKRKGPLVGFPRFHRRSSRQSFRFTTGSFGVADPRHVRLPRIGVVRTKEPTTALLRRVGVGATRVLSATVSERAGRWHVSFGVEADRAESSASQPEVVVGVDVGVKVLAVLSTGEAVPNPKHVDRYRRRMTRLQSELSRRRGPAKGHRPSKRWNATNKRLARAHAKVADARADGLHKLTTRLATSYGTIVVENLNVKAMTASARGSGHWRGKAGLNRSLVDASPAELRRQLAYKTTWHGSTLVVADRWYPSSKTCSACKTAKAKLPLAERTFRCEHCGLVIDRDLNAATNLASLVEVIGTASGAGTGQGTVLANAQGEEKFMGSPRCSSTNCEDGTSPTGPRRTVTAAEQSTAA
ncbi:MAG: IS607 family element RNA-guided endonuclease TnpB [Acidimicrobiia bacterium]